MAKTKQKDIIESEITQKENEELLLKYQTAQKKVQFIQEIKNGLGDEIIKNKGNIRLVKKPWYMKISIFLKKLFTKF